MFRLTTRYFAYTQQIVTDEHFYEMIRQAHLEEELLKEVAVLFAECRAREGMQEGEFKWNILQLNRQTKTDLFQDALVESLDTLLTGKNVGGKHFSGYDAASDLIQNAVNRIDNMDGEGLQIVHMQEGMSVVLESYAKRKHGINEALPTDIDDVDDGLSGGFTPGDFVFVAGYTSDGKSTMAYTWAERWVFRYGKNVVIGTAENSVEVVQRRIIAMRSADPVYGLEKPLDYKRIKEGKLTPNEERVLELIVKDCKDNPKYGKLTIFRIPPRAKGSYIFNILHNINHLYPIHAYVWDYINYSKSEDKWKERRDDLGTLIQDSKTATMSFDNRGLITVTPYQVSRGRWETALKDGRYTLACMADTSEAEKAADVVISILRLETRNACQMLKARDGVRKDAPFDLDFDKITQRYLPKIVIGGRL